MSLYPTKTRLALLEAVAAGEVLVDRYGQAAYADAQGTPWGTRVTARWAELARAGWVVRPEGDDPRWMVGLLTDEGRKILEDNRG